MFEKWQEQMDKGNQAFTMRDFVSAEQHFQAAVQDAEKFGHNNLSLAQSLERLSDAIYAQAPLENEQIESCFSSLERAEGIYEAAYGPIHLKVAYCLTHMSKLMVWFDVGEAEKQARRAISIYDELGSDEVIVPTEILMGILHLTDKREERIQLILNLISKFEQKGESSSVGLAKALIVLAKSQPDEDPDAIANYKKALAILSDKPEHRALLVEANVWLGRLLFQKEEFSAAESAFKDALAQGECDPNIQAVMLEEALCRMARLQVYYYQNYKEAEKLLAHAEEIKETKGFGPLGSGVDTEHSFLARASGDYTRHEKYLRQTLKDLREKVSTESEWAGFQQMSIVMQELAIAAIAYRKGDIEEALELWESAVKGSEAGGWMGDKAVFKLALACSKTGRMDRARELMDTGLKTVTEETGADNIALCIVTEYKLGRTENIDRLIGYLHAGIEREMHEPESEFSFLPALSLAWSLATTGREDEAIKALNDCFARMKKDSLFTAISFEEWSRLFEEENAHDGAVMLRDKAQMIRKRIHERERQLSSAK
jgi:tetratricopeptide (TPR) repeat protein